MSTRETKRVACEYRSIEPACIDPPVLSPPPLSLCPYFTSSGYCGSTPKRKEMNAANKKKYQFKSFTLVWETEGNVRDTKQIDLCFIH